jgi:hypothetical protein
MSNHNLTYQISKRTPASPKVLKEILEAQAAVNAACTWTHERLAFAAPRESGRAPFTFPLGRFAFASGPMSFPSDGSGTFAPVPSADAFVQGSTRVRDNLWNAHLVAAFLKHVSQMHPSLAFQLQDEGGFVLPGSVLIRGGNVEVNRAYLNQERARALEFTGDPQAAAPYVWAELQGLSGSFFLDVPAREFGGVREVQELEATWDQLETMSAEDIATAVVEHATKEAAPAMA